MHFCSCAESLLKQIQLNYFLQHYEIYLKNDILFIFISNNRSNIGTFYIYAFIHILYFYNSNCKKMFKCSKV